MKAATSIFVSFLPSVSISIHAAREGGDASLKVLLFNFKLFQSTPPVKAATVYNVYRLRDLDISIHAAREGGDAGKKSCVP